MGGRIRLSVGVVRFEHMDPTEAEVPPQDVRILRTDFFLLLLPCFTPALSWFLFFCLVSGRFLCYGREKTSLCCSSANSRVFQGGLGQRMESDVVGS